MTRYYYDCPIKAAYMAKYFNVTFAGSDGLERTYLGMADEIIPSHLPEIATPIYIHPDSLHILEPQEGDIYVDYWSDRSPEYYTPLKEKPDNSLEPPNWVGYKIIQRNGKPFMWPESE